LSGANSPSYRNFKTIIIDRTCPRLDVTADNLHVLEVN
jgi:hypothetical protein